MNQFDPLRFKADFPIFTKHPELIYLDNAATAMRPQLVLDALNGFYTEYNANVHRALYDIGARATQAYEDARAKVREFVNAASEREIVFTSGTTASINLVAYSWARSHLETGDVVLLSEMEHHSNLIPWQLVAAEKGASLAFIPYTEDGRLDLDALPAVWSDKVKFVALSYTSNVFGVENEVKRVIDFAHERDALVLLDGAQAVPHGPVDVRAIDVDFLAFSGHKMGGPMGTGVLYAKEALLESMPPFLGGGEMILSVWYDRATWAELPYKFEAGTPNAAGAVGLGAAVDYLRGVGMQAIHDYVSELTEYAYGRLREVEDIDLYGRHGHGGGIIAFNMKKAHSHDVAQFLDTRHIAVRSGHHCAHPLMRKMGVAATARASFYLYNTKDDVDALVKALVDAQGFFHGL